MKHILLVKLRGIGDSVLSLPSVEALKKLFPQARVSVLVPPASVEVFSADPRVHEVIPYDKAWFKSLKHHLSHASGLQRRGFDFAFVPHASFRTGLIAWSSGALRRSVRNHSGRDWFNTEPCPFPKEPKSILEREFDGLKALGWHGPVPMPRMAVGREARAWAAAWWAKAKPGRKTVALAPGASVADRRWPMGRFIALAARLERKGRRVVWIVAPGEAAPSGALVASPPGVQALGALAARCGLLIGNNSGPRHVAAACGARTIALFGQDLPREWHPYRESDGHIALRADSGRVNDLGVNDVMGRIQ
jgi:ADP-heptose:LPS heptosyltransferase